LALSIDRSGIFLLVLEFQGGGGLGFPGGEKRSGSRFQTFWGRSKKTVDVFGVFGRPVVGGKGGGRWAGWVRHITLVGAFGNGGGPGPLKVAAEKQKKKGSPRGPSTLAVCSNEGLLLWGRSASDFPGQPRGDGAGSGPPGRPPGDFRAGPPANCKPWIFKFDLLPCRKKAVVPRQLIGHWGSSRRWGSVRRGCWRGGGRSQTAAAFPPSQVGLFIFVQGGLSDFHLEKGGGGKPKEGKQKKTIKKNDFFLKTRRGDGGQVVRGPRVLGPGGGLFFSQGEGVAREGSRAGRGMGGCGPDVFGSVVPFPAGRVFDRKIASSEIRGLEVGAIVFSGPGPAPKIV